MLLYIYIKSWRQYHIHLSQIIIRLTNVGQCYLPGLGSWNNDLRFNRRLRLFELRISNNNPKSSDLQYAPCCYQTEISRTLYIYFNVKRVSFCSSVAANSAGQSMQQMRATRQQQTVKQADRNIPLWTVLTPTSVCPADWPKTSRICSYYKKYTRFRFVNETHITLYIFLSQFVAEVQQAL